MVLNHMKTQILQNHLAYQKIIRYTWQGQRKQMAFSKSPDAVYISLPIMPN